MKSDNKEFNMNKKKRSIGIIIILLGSVIFLSQLIGDKSKYIGEEFIRALVNENTYKNHKEGVDGASEYFETYFSKEGYEAFILNKIPYLYPALLNKVEGMEYQKLNIKCMSKREEGGLKLLEYEVKYTIITKDGKIKLKDYIEIGLDERGIMKSVVVLNTSDIMQELILDVKVQ